MIKIADSEDRAEKWERTKVKMHGHRDKWRPKVVYMSRLNQPLRSMHENTWSSNKIAICLPRDTHGKNTKTHKLKRPTPIKR